MNDKKTVEELMEMLVAAHKELCEAVQRQWNGKTALSMSIPARPEHDSDLIIGGAIREAQAAIEALRSENADLKARVGELEEAVTALGPFVIVAGDSIHHLTPESRQVLNSSTCWIVGREEKTRHLLERLRDTLIARLEKSRGGEDYSEQINEADY